MPDSTEALQIRITQTIQQMDENTFKKNVERTGLPLGHQECYETSTHTALKTRAINL
jgi:hypothetical protein